MKKKEADEMNVLVLTVLVGPDLNSIKTGMQTKSGEENGEKKVEKNETVDVSQSSCDPCALIIINNYYLFDT